MSTTLVVDTSCLLHAWEQECTQAVDSDATLKCLLAWTASGLYLPFPVDRVVFALDQKDGSRRYWRHEYMQRPEVVTNILRAKKRKTNSEKEALALLEKGSPVRIVDRDNVGIIPDVRIPSYKGGRKLPTTAFKRLKRKAYKLLADRGYQLFSAKGYEADDIASYICRKFPEEHLALLTVDTDWMGLVSDRIYWYEMGNRKPRYRYHLQHINQWAIKRLKVELDKPSDIWKVKSIQGDRSDNLPPGSPIEVIDLLHPPKEYDLMVSQPFNSLGPHLKTKEEKGLRALTCLMKMGVKPYPSILDLRYMV